MGKYNFLEAGKICMVPRPGAIKSPGCLECLENFRANMAVAQGGTMLPGATFWFAIEWVKAGTQASQFAYGVNATEKQKADNSDLIGRLAEQNMSMAMRLKKREQYTHLVAKTTMFETLAEKAGSQTEDMLHNILRGVIVQSWTAFEFLTEELFTTAEGEAKSPPPRLISKRGRDLTGFRSRSKIRDAYEFGFAIDGAKIMRPLDDKSVDALALLRNVIVHKAGNADEEFITGAGKTPLLAQYAGLKEDTMVIVDGMAVHSIVSPVIQHAYAMIEAVDVWLKTH